MGEKSFKAHDYSIRNYLVAHLLEAQLLEQDEAKWMELYPDFSGNVKLVLVTRPCPIDRKFKLVTSTVLPFAPRDILNEDEDELYDLPAEEDNVFSKKQIQVKNVSFTLLTWTPVEECDKCVEVWLKRVPVSYINSKFLNSGVSQGFYQALQVIGHFGLGMIARDLFEKYFDIKKNTFKRNGKMSNSNDYLLIEGQYTPQDTTHHKTLIGYVKIYNDKKVQFITERMFNDEYGYGNDDITSESEQTAKEDYSNDEEDDEIDDDDDDDDVEDDTQYDPEDGEYVPEHSVTPSEKDVKASGRPKRTGGRPTRSIKRKAETSITPPPAKKQRLSEKNISNKSQKNRVFKKNDDNNEDYNKSVSATYTDAEVWSIRTNGVK